MAEKVPTAVKYLLSESARPSGQDRQHSTQGNMQPHEEEEEQQEEEEEEQQEEEEEEQHGDPGRGTHGDPGHGTHGDPGGGTHGDPGGGTHGDPGRGTHGDPGRGAHGGRRGMGKVTRGLIGAAVGVGSGIAAGSIAAKMMSAAAIANGGGVAAGSLVSILQSVGAAGFSTATQVGLSSILGTVGGAVGAASTPEPRGGKKPKK
ncbi:keratin, type I cytoskeletal 9-like isoform X3 [Melanerpes formicivorus]|uniref:keratin, type I cytoskeletal 9-like isoform X3 n=1 Tax=Melanerpes formicivorus TaxID=211600 RepID=UPI00358E112B